ncbi:thioesterase superfamily protein [Paenibacillus vortex V453]|uniref:Thioesterase superfamily protein n=1 Tax=Paenibacillus vortex V453 TaxID=715225 RepID=A0A2R9SY00_9BACL|nr:thioesterase superfamily protein [Paenibacillus vortex V453]
MNNVSYFMYFEQGRIEYFENLGLTEDLFSDKTVSVVADLECLVSGTAVFEGPAQASCPGVRDRAFLDGCAVCDCGGRCLKGCRTRNHCAH